MGVVGGNAKTCPCFYAGFKIQTEEFSLTVTQGQREDQSQVIGSHLQGDANLSVIAKTYLRCKHTNQGGGLTAVMPLTSPLTGAPRTIKHACGNNFIIIIHIFSKFLYILFISGYTYLSTSKLLLFTVQSMLCSIYLFIWGFTSFSTLYRSYYDG